MKRNLHAALGCLLLAGCFPLLPVTAETPATVSDRDFAVIFQLEQKVQEQPYNPDFLCALAEALERVKRSKEAESLYKKALSIRADHRVALRAVGSAHLRRHELEPAMKAFRKLFDLAPKDPLANAAIGQIYFEMKRFSTAVRFFRQALAAAGDDKIRRLATVQLVKCLAETGQKAQVEELYRELRTKRKQDAIEVYEYLQKMPKAGDGLDAGSTEGSGDDEIASLTPEVAANASAPAVVYPPVTASEEDLIRLEKQVLRAVLQAEVASPARDPFKVYVLQEDFVKNPQDDLESSVTAEKTGREMLPEARAALPHFIGRNRDAASMAASLELPWEISLLSQNEQNKIFSLGKAGWKEFYKRYPGSTGILGCSRPGFSAGLDGCVVYFERRWGANEGVGKALFLEKVEDAWTVIDQIPLWKY